MSFPKPVEPTLVESHPLHGDVFSHPAYGVMTVSHPRGGDKTMFGSGVPAPSCVCVTVHQANHKRSLSNDWYHPGPVLVEFEMTHAQWSQVVANPGRGEGTPVTLRWTRGEGNLPGIKPIETRHEQHQREIKASAKERVAEAEAALERLKNAFEAGAGKKEMRELIGKALHSVGALPGSVSFVVDQAHEALDASVAEAKIEVESFIAAKVAQVGFKTLQSMGDAIDRLTNEGDDPALFIGKVGG